MIVESRLGIISVSFSYGKLIGHTPLLYILSFLVELQFCSLFFFTDDNEDGFFTKDVFISYSGKDYDWVKEHLMPLLDHNQIDYIIHSRDFEPGKAWIENMADSVYNSRKVMLIMSANYLASGFCKDEMYMATHRESAKNDASLIVVVLMLGSMRTTIYEERCFINCCAH